MRKQAQANKLTQTLLSDPTLHLVVLDELTDVKHAFRAGIKAQPGIDL